MANQKLVTLEQMEIVKDYIDKNDEGSIKSAEYENNAIKLFTTADKSGDPAVTLNLPEEMFLDQVKTTFEPNFSYSLSEHGSIDKDPHLDGKPVLVLAVKGDEGVNYSFVSLETLVSKVSEEEGNILTLNSDGFYVPSPEKVSIEYATDEEVQALFSD